MMKQVKIEQASNGYVVTTDCCGLQTKVFTTLEEVFVQLVKDFDWQRYGYDPVAVAISKAAPGNLRVEAR